MSMFIGEALVGDGNEIAHIDLLIGDKSRPGGDGLRRRPGEPEAGLLEPAGRVSRIYLQARHGHDHQGDDQGRQSGRADVRPSPEGRRQGRQRQRRRGRSFPRPTRRIWSSSVGVFIHWEAKDNDKIYQFNYDATKLAIKRAMKGEPKIDEILAKKDTMKHPFYK